MKGQYAVLDKARDSVSRTPTRPKTDWRSQIRSGFHDPATLLRHLGLPARSDSDTTAFPLRVPRVFVNRMGHGDPNDPLLLQVLPDPDELVSAPGFSSDPVGDLDSRSAPGVLHKYQGRALLMTTGACAVHCRYCFRQHYPYAGQTIGPRRWQAALTYLTDNPDIAEVILSGGDPLMLSTEQLRSLTDDLRRIRTIRRLRLHTRMPIVLPDRVTPDLLNWLQGLSVPVVIVVHANHAREFDDSVDRALAQLRACGVHLLNQSVLMRGINDSAASLADLMEKSFRAGVLPYYLHQLDRVTGGARFEVQDRRARALLLDLRIRLPGYLVPRLVREERGQAYKLPLL